MWCDVNTFSLRLSPSRRHWVLNERGLLRNHENNRLVVFRAAPRMRDIVPQSSWRNNRFFGFTAQPHCYDRIPISEPVSCSQKSGNTFPAAVSGATEVEIFQQIQIEVYPRAQPPSNIFPSVEYLGAEPVALDSRCLFFGKPNSRD